LNLIWNWRATQRETIFRRTYFKLLEYYYLKTNPSFSENQVQLVYCSGHDRLSGKPARPDDIAAKPERPSPRAAACSARRTMDEPSTRGGKASELPSCRFE
jgi:hypothetical protein